MPYFFFIFFQRFYLFLGQRETEHERGRGRERGRHRIGNRLQALSHQPRARCGARTPGPRDRDLAEIGRSTDCATQAPHPHLFLIKLKILGLSHVHVAALLMTITIFCFHFYICFESLRQCFKEKSAALRKTIKWGGEPC